MEDIKNEIKTKPSKRNILDKDKITELNPKQEEFCRLYATDPYMLGNGVKCYTEAYKPDQTKKNRYKTACATSSEILSNPMVYNRINDLLEEKGLNDQFVDKQLLHLISQHDDKSSKISAIREYNKLKQRITDKIENSGTIEFIIKK